MQKTILKIAGMHCNSCALLIEEKLKNLPGVIQARISHESGKGVIVYDENAIEEMKIQNEIKSAGKYSIVVNGGNGDGGKKTISTGQTAQAQGLSAHPEPSSLPTGQPLTAN